MRAKITIVCLVLLSLALPAFALSITERNSESGAPEIVMENQYVKLIVAQKGGLISSFFYKPTGKEMVKTINDSDGPFGLLRDQFWQPNGYFREQFYLADIQQNQDSVELTLSATGPSGTHFFTKIEKTIIMRQACKI